MSVLVLSVSTYETACVQIVEDGGPVTLERAGIADAFHPHVAAFEAEWGHQLSWINVQLVDGWGPGVADGATVALCQWSGQPGDVPTVSVDRMWWLLHPTYVDREAIVYHELGHCALGRDHLDDLVPWAGTDPPVTRPTSMMNTYVAGWLQAYREFRTEYVAELLGREVE